MTERDRLRAEIEGLVERFGRGRSALVPTLQEIERKHRKLDSYAQQVIADRLGIHPAEVYSVVSFYAFLGQKPRGRFVLRLCRTIACDMQGKDRVMRQLENDLGIAFGQTTPDGLFTLEWTNCMGMCDQGPALLVNDRVHSSVTPDQVPEILGECRRAFGPHGVADRAEEP